MKKPARIARNDVVLDHRVLQRAQHDPVVAVAPGAVVAHDLAAYFHQCQPAAVGITVVVLPQVVVRIHVVRAVAAVVQPVAAEFGMVRDIDVERVANETDVVADDACTGGVVELHAVAALRRAVFALADDQVVLDAYIVGLLDPQSEQVVDESRGERRRGAIPGRR